MITNLYLSHFKSITDQSISLEEINIIVGKNGSGKSNIVDAIAFLADVAKEDLDYAITKRHGADSIRQWSRYKPYHTTLSVNIRTKEGEGFYKITFSSSRNEYRIQEEILEWSGEVAFDDDRYQSKLIRSAAGAISVETDYHVDSDEEDQKFGVSESVLNHITKSYSSIYELFSYLVDDIRSFEAFTIFPNTIRAPQTVSGAVALEPDGKNIASIIKQMVGDKRRSRDRIVRALRAVLPQVTAISVKSTAGYNVPVFSVSEPTGEVHELNMSQISDGTLRMLGILVAFHQDKAPNRIALEEPEQMIHPALLESVRDAVVNFVSRKKRGQVFITTHSPVLVDLFDHSHVIAVYFRDGSTHFGRVSKRQIEVVKSGLMSVGDILMAEDLEID